MQDLIIAIGFAVVALTMLVGATWRRLFGTVENGIASVRRELSGPRRADGRARVTLLKTVPLSEEMVKEVAAIDGYEFAGRASGRGSRTVLTFDPPRNEPHER